MPYFCNQLGSNYAYFLEAWWPWDINHVSYLTSIQIVEYMDYTMWMWSSYSGTNKRKYSGSITLPIPTEILNISHIIFLQIFTRGMHLLDLCSFLILAFIILPFSFSCWECKFHVIQRHLPVNKLSLFSYYYIIYIIYQHPLLSPQSVRKWNI